MRKALVLANLLVLASTALAQEAGDSQDYVVLETWRCFASSDYSKKKTLVLLTKREHKELGFIAGAVNVAGVSYLSTFSVNGFDRRWNFGDDSDYSFIIKPDGDGLYYDFSMAEEGGTVKPSQFFNCVMK